MYRKTKRSQETLAKMRHGKELARMARPPEARAPELPDLRRRLIVENFDFAHTTHVLEFYKTNRIDCFRVVVDGKPWKPRIGWSKAPAGSKTESLRNKVAAKRGNAGEEVTLDSVLKGSRRRTTMPT